MLGDKIRIVRLEKNHSVAQPHLFGRQPHSGIRLNLMEDNREGEQQGRNRAGGLHSEPTCRPPRNAPVSSEQSQAACRQQRHGKKLLARYTYGKSIDQSSGLAEAVNPLNPSFDMTHNLVASYPCRSPSWADGIYPASPGSAAVSQQRYSIQQRG